MVALLSVHPSRRGRSQEPDQVTVDGDGTAFEYRDSFGNICTRLVAQPGTLRLTNSTLIHDSGSPDPVSLGGAGSAGPGPASRDAALPDGEPILRGGSAVPVAAELFGDAPRGWARVQAVCDWVNAKVTFSYPHARPTRTALGVYTERIGVCRDFQHLAVTFCRCPEHSGAVCDRLPRRHRCSRAPAPMDFSAWFEAYLEDRWWTFDARHNHPRIGRVLLATGLDATDVAITTSFGSARLSHFEVVTDEIAG